MNRRRELIAAVEQLSVDRTRPFTGRQADGAGIGKSERATLRASGALASPHRGIFATGISRTVPDRARAASLLLPAGGAIGRRTGAELLGVDPRTPWERDQQLDVECLVPRGHVPIRRPGVRSFATDLLDTEIDRSRGFPVTTPDRTAADLLRWLPPFMALAVLDRMAAGEVITVAGVEAILDRWDRHRNVATARRLLDNVEPKAESYGESWLRMRILDAGFPRPVAQVPIMDGDRVVYWLDLGWPDLRIGAEYDGEEFHSDRKDLDHDDERREALCKRYGWTVVGFRKGHVLGAGTALEYALGELLGMTPTIVGRRR